MDLNLYRLVLAEDNRTTQLHVVDETLPDDGTRINLEELLAYRLKKDGAWPSANAHVVRIEWLGVIDREGIPVEWLGERMVG